jgi:predicted F0F1-ATPase subunit
MSKTSTTVTAATAQRGRREPAAGDVKKRIDQTADPIADDAQRYALMMDARNRFIGVTFGMGWRMAITFMVPVALGIWLDDLTDSTPSYTITAVFLGVAASAAVVWNTVKSVNAEGNVADLKRTEMNDAAATSDYPAMTAVPEKEESDSILGLRSDEDDDV